MSERLLIRLAADGQMSWLAQDAAGRALSASNAGVPPPAALARARRVVVFVPAEQVLVAATDVLPARRAQLAKAIPFALEDQLASAVEDLHFALPARTGSGRLTVAVVARAVLRGWLDALAQDGIRPDAMLPETLALPDRADGATLLIDGERALVRAGAAQAFACETANLPAWLEAVAPSQVDVYDFRQAPRLALSLPVHAYHERQADVLAFLAAHAGEPALNLLQGEFAPAHREAGAARWWRRAAALGAAAVLLALAYTGGDYWRLRRQADALERAQRDVLRTNLPDFADVPGDPRSLMESAIARMRGDTRGGGVLALLGRVAPVVAGTTRVQLTGIEYRNATLELALRAPDVAALDLVREQLSSLGGLKVEVTAANSGDKGVDGRLRISGAAS